MLVMRQLIDHISDLQNEKLINKFKIPNQQLKL